MNMSQVCQSWEDVPVRYTQSFKLHLFLDHITEMAENSFIVIVII